MLKAGGLAALSFGAGPRFLRRLALAAPGGGYQGKTIVPIFLRGAMDGLMAVQPLDDPFLQRHRPHLMMDATRSGAQPLIDLQGQFGLHPAFAPLLPLWNDGRFAIVHGVGSPHSTRSHFDAQDFIETGTPGLRGTSSGWLNRVAAQARGRHGSPSPLRMLSMTEDLPRSLYGPESALAIEDLKDFQLLLPADEALAEKLEIDMEKLYSRGRGNALRQQGEEMYDALQLLSQEELAVYRQERGHRYPTTPLGQSLLQIAFLIKSRVGLEIACTESSGWDTHVAQGTGAGRFASQARDLADCVRAFWEDIEPFHDKVVVLTMTEFGRTVRENGSGGTDHGHGSCLFLLGNQVDGGKTYGEVPELAPELLFENRDLPIAVDFRSVFSEVAGKLFQIQDDRRVFPGWNGLRLPVLW